MVSRKTRGKRGETDSRKSFRRRAIFRDDTSLSCHTRMRGELGAAQPRQGRTKILGLCNFHDVKTRLFPWSCVDTILKKRFTHSLVLVDWISESEPVFFYISYFSTFLTSITFLKSYKNFSILVSRLILIANFLTNLASIFFQILKDRYYQILLIFSNCLYY